MKPIHPATTALVSLIVLQTVMLLAMFFQAPPHPPYETPLFGMGPLLGMSLVCAIAAIMQGGSETRPGRFLSMGAAVLAMVSYGPQKWFDAAIAQIWPAVGAAQIATAIIMFSIYRAVTASSPNHIPASGN
ncbi:MAG: hypothetical protein AAFO77_10545 [Pseudomonadota bacterium]